MSTRKGKSTNNMAMVAGSFYIPKKKPLGEDAHFVDGVVQVIGVADGVSACKLMGIDAGIFARELMGHAASIVEERRHPVNPKHVLQEAFSKSRSPGACTACIMALTDGNILRATNVGDTAFLVIRRGKVVFSSPVQLIGFNCPCQIATMGCGVELAEEFEVAVQAGDVIVAGSDGLFDNLFPAEIEELVKSSSGKDHHPDILAKSLAAAALEKSLDRSCDSPFAVAAREAGLVHHGGKYDDITAVVAYVEAIPKPNTRKYYGCLKWWGQNKIKPRNKF